MNKFNFRDRNFFRGRHSIGLLLVFIALANYFGSEYLGTKLEPSQTMLISALFGIIGLTVVFTYDGILIDFNNRRIKYYVTIAGFRKGEWKSIPNDVSIEFSSEEEASTNMANGVSPTLTTVQMVHYVRIVSSTNSSILAELHFSSEDKAKKHYAKIKSGFGL